MKYITLLSVLLMTLSACGGSGSGGGDSSAWTGYGIEQGDIFTNAVEASGAQAFEEHWDNGALRAKGYRLKSGDTELLVGPYQSYYENGQMASEGFFWQGKMNGPWHFWYESGQQRMEGFYVDNQLNKELFWLERDESGNVVNGSKRATQLAAAEPTL